MNIQYFNIILSVISTLAVAIPVVIQLIGLNNRSLNGIQKKMNIYERIIINRKNRVLSYTLLKEYIGFSISDNMINFILTSTKFYEIVTYIKNTCQYIDYDAKENRLVFKKNKKPSRKLFLFLYAVFSLPIIFSVAFSNFVIQRPEYIISAIALLVPFIMANIYFLIEVGNRTLAIRLIEKMK